MYICIQIHITPVFIYISLNFVFLSFISPLGLEISRTSARGPGSLRELLKSSRLQELPETCGLLSGDPKEALLGADAEYTTRATEPMETHRGTSADVKTLLCELLHI